MEDQNHTIYRGPHQTMLYHEGVLHIIDDNEVKFIRIPVSRWRLVDIAYGCLLTAITSKG